MDILPIISDNIQTEIKKDYKTELTKFIRYNSQAIHSTHIRHQGSIIFIELTLKSNRELSEKIQEIQDLIKSSPF